MCPYVPLEKLDYPLSWKLTSPDGWRFNVNVMAEAVGASASGMERDQRNCGSGLPITAQVPGLAGAKSRLRRRVERAYLIVFLHTRTI